MLGSSEGGWRLAAYLLRFFVAGCLYCLGPVCAAWLVSEGRHWLGLGLILGSLLVCTGLLLVFSVLPVPSSPRVLRTNDFSDLSWLPHVAVTRLTSRELGRRAPRRVALRCLAVVLVVLGLNGGALLMLCAHTGPAHAVWWISAASVLYCLIVVMGFVGREIAASRHPPAPGTDIG